MEWIRLDQKGEPPGPRSSHAAAVSGGNLYIFGGEQEPRKPLPSDLYCYDLRSSSWKKVQATGDAPKPRNACSMAAIGSTLFVFGGRTGIDIGEGALADLHVFDTNTLEWSALEPSGAPPGRSYHTMAAVRDKIYIFGGCGTNGRLNDLHEYNPATHSWRQLPSSDKMLGRGGSVLVSSGSRLFILGGFSGRELDECHCFDLQTGAWSCLCCSPQGTSTSSGWTMPLPRSVFGAVALPPKASTVQGGSSTTDGGSSCCSHAGHVLAFGGEVDPSDKGHEGAGAFTAAVWCFDPDEVACSKCGPRTCWHEVAAAGSGPGPRGWFACAGTESGLLVHGGVDLDNQRLGDMYLLRVGGGNP